MNVFTFYGHAGDGAIVRDLPNGSSVMEVRVANNQGYGEKQKTNWIRVSLYGPRGVKLSEYIRKGSPLFVSGELTISEYLSNTDGAKKFQMNVNADVLELLGKNSDGQKSNDSQPSNSPTSLKDSTEFNPDELPF
jgi:single-strand DNA-binding protein